MQCSHLFWKVDKDLQRAIILTSHTFLSKKVSQCPCVRYYQKPGKGLNRALQSVSKDWSGLAGEESSSPSMGMAPHEGRAVSRAPVLSLTALAQPQVKNRRLWHSRSFP